MIFYSKDNFVIQEKCKVLFLQNSFAEGKNFKMYEGLKCTFLFFTFTLIKRYFILRATLAILKLSCILCIVKDLTDFKIFSNPLI